MAQDVESLGRVNGDAVNLGALGQHLVKVLKYAVDPGHDNIAAFKEEFRAGGPLRHLCLFAIDDEGDLLGI
ncbi:hypothetical protein GCM10027405_00040 [Arthrobacter alkaliphilus]